MAALGREVLDRYFTLEDPRRLEPAERELYVEALLDSKLLLRGFVDRIDVAPDGAIRISDYKTGSAPGVDYEAKALFQMKFYALVIWRMRGVIPRQLQLIYLGNGEIVRYEPDEDDLLATERKVNALWEAIRLADELREWQPNRSRACDWCSFKAVCPAWGGTPPPVPREAGQTRCRSAHSAALVRSPTPMVAKIEVRCALTVRSVMPSRRAICLLARPSRTSASTSRSRGVRSGMSAEGRRVTSSSRAARGWIGDSPRATARMPSRMSSGSASFSR